MVPALVDPARPWYRLTLPGTTQFCAFPPPRLYNNTPALDPLLVWPDVWSDVHADAWRKALVWDVNGRRTASITTDVGFNLETLNYVFNDVYSHIPSTRNTSNGQLGFEATTTQHHEKKMTNFRAALTYIHQYPRFDHMQSILGMSRASFVNWVQPTLYSMAAAVNYVDWNLRC